MTQSTPARAGAIAERSPTSATQTSAPACPSQAASSPGRMSARGLSPRVTSRVVTWLPRKPAAPVTRIVIVFPIFVISRQAQCATQGQAHGAEARQAGKGHKDSRPRVREQEHRAHSGFINPEYVGENQQSDELVAADLPGGRGQDE